VVVVVLSYCFGCCFWVLFLVVVVVAGRFRLLLLFLVVVSGRYRLLLLFLVVVSGCSCWLTFVDVG